jgi:signal transduction histidine kinase
MVWGTAAAAVAVVLLAILIWLTVVREALEGILVGLVLGGAVALLATVGFSLLVRGPVFARTIGVRLRASLVFMALLPALGISVGSAVPGYINGRQQGINHLESVTALRDLELATWSESLQNVLLAALNEEYAAERASVVLDLAGNHYYSEYYSQAMRVRLQILLNHSPGFKELMLVDRSGQIVLSTDVGNQGGTLAAQPLFRAGLSGAFLQLPFALSEDASWAFVARPVTGAGGEALGVIVGRVAVDPLVRILSDGTGFGRTGKMYLVDGAGVVLSAGPGRPAETGGGAAAGGLQRAAHPEAAVAARIDHPGVYTDLRGTQVVGYYRQLDDLGAVLAAEQDLSEALRTIFSALAVNMGVSLLAVLLAAVAAILLAQSITRPLVDLVDTATEIAEGDLQRTARIQRDDEVGRLAVAFNTMTAQLRDLILNLEQRVADRTRTLQDAIRAEQRRALQLETSAQVSQEITSILETGELLNRVVALIQGAFGYYHVNVYLMAADELVLRASTQEVQPRLQRARLDTTSLNTQAALANKPVLVNDVRQDPRYLLDEHLPETRSELVIPLRLGNEVIGTLDLVSAQTDAFSAEDAVVFQSVADQVAIAIENARLYERSRELAVVEERTRLARDLHDSVTQTLSSLNILVEGWRRQIEAGESYQVETYLDRVGHITDRALREMRLMVHELRPSRLDKEGLLDALHHRLEVVEKRFGIEARLIAEELFELPAPVEKELYWIAQEALNNALKHSGAANVTVRLQRQEGGAVVLTVVDDGRGFEAGTAASRRGIGLLNMEERAKQLGGTLEVITAIGAGTTVKATLPSTGAEQSGRGARDPHQGGQDP